MYIISWNVLEAALQGKRNQERSDHLPHSANERRVTMEGSLASHLVGRETGTLGLIHSFECLRITALPTLIHTQLRHHVQEGSQYVSSSLQLLLQLTRAPKFTAGQKSILTALKLPEPPRFFDFTVPSD